MVKQYSVYWVSLDPTKGSEVQKTRPAVVISPDIMNNNLRTVIIAPITSKLHDLPTRVSVAIKKGEGHVMLDQIRTIDKIRLTGNAISTLSSNEIENIKNTIHEMLVK